MIALPPSLVLLLVLLLGAAHLGLPICSAVVFAWCVDFRRASWTPRDYAVTILLATAGPWSVLAVITAALAGSAAPATPLGEFYGRTIQAAVLALWLAPLCVMGASALGLARWSIAPIALCGVLLFAASYLPSWLGGFTSGLAAWHAIVLGLLVLEAGASRRAADRVGRCITCGYPTGGLPTARCPECGTGMRCRACGFDLAGLQPTAPCPECGTRPAAI